MTEKQQLDLLYRNIRAIENLAQSIHKRITRLEKKHNKPVKKISK